jgi:hypothetical protein
VRDLTVRFLEWVMALLAPARGRHRASQAPAPALVGPTVARRLRTTQIPPRMVGEPIDGDATALVRPYLAAYEQRERRTALLLALDGIDMPGPVWIHGVEVAA